MVDQARSPRGNGVEVMIISSGFRSASLVFSSPEAHCNSFSCQYLVAHACMSVTLCTVMKCNMREFHVKILVLA